MKISKEQLKKIIQEEIVNIVNESVPPEERIMEEESLSAEEEADVIQDQILRQMHTALEQGLEEIYEKRGISSDFPERDSEALELRRRIEREIENKLHDMTMAYVRHGENSDD